MRRRRFLALLGLAGVGAGTLAVARIRPTVIQLGASGPPYTALRDSDDLTLSDTVDYELRYPQGRVKQGTIKIRGGRRVVVIAGRQVIVIKRQPLDKLSPAE
jgi:hypothetical protein